MTDNPLTGEVVPFGKYQGNPVEVAAADDGYREWVLAQPWVRERYPRFHRLLLSGGPVPQTSPEHNQMQAQFLDEGVCLRLARLIPGLANDGFEDAVRQYQHELDCDGCTKGHDKPGLRGYPGELNSLPGSVEDRRFENRGWDVTFSYSSAQLMWRCTCDPGPKPDVSPTPTGPSWLEEQRALDQYLQHKREFHRGGRTWMHLWAATVAAELKPDLGDDYPAVLRQVQGYLTERRQDPLTRAWGDVRTCDRAFVVVRRAQFSTVTWDQVREIFRTSGILLVREADLLQEPGNAPVIAS